MEDKSGSTESEQKTEPILTRLLKPCFHFWDKLTGEDRRSEFDAELTKAKEALDDAILESDKQHKAYGIAVAEKREKKRELRTQLQSACEAVKTAEKKEDQTIRGTPEAKAAQDAHASAISNRDGVIGELDKVEDTWPKRSACIEAEAQVREKITLWQRANNRKTLADGGFNRRSKSLAFMSAISSMGLSMGFAFYNSHGQLKRGEEQKTQFKSLEDLAVGLDKKVQSLRRYLGDNTEETKIEPPEVGGDPQPEKKGPPPPEPLEVCEKRRMVADFLLVGVVALAVWGRGGS